MGNASSQVAQTQDTTTRTESTTPGTMATRTSPTPRSSSSYDDADDYLAATQLQQELGSPVGLPSPRFPTTRTNKGLSDGHGSNGSPSLGRSRRAPAPAAFGERKAATMAPASAPPKQSRPCGDAPGPLDVLFPDEHEPSLPEINTLSLTALVPRFAGSASARSSGVVQVPNTQKGSYAAFNELPSPETPRYTVPASSIETGAGGKARMRIITVNMGDSESPQPESPQPASGNWTSSTQEASNGRAVPRARGPRKAVPAASIAPILPKDRMKILKAGRSAEIGSGMSPGYHKIIQPLLEQTVHERVHALPRRVGGIAAETRRDSHGRQQLQVQQKVSKINAQTPYASPAAAAAQFASPGKDRRSYIWSSSSSSSKRQSRVVPVGPGEEAGPAVGPSAVKPPNLVEELSGATSTQQPTTPSPAAVTDHLHTRPAGSATKATTKNTPVIAAGPPAASLQTSSPLAREIFASLEEIARGTQALMALDFSTPAMPVPQTKSRKRKSKAEDSHDADFPSGHVPAEEAPAQPKKNKTSSTDAAAELVEAAPEAAEQVKEKKKKSKKRGSEGAEREVPETQPIEIDESAAAVATEAADETTEPAAAPQEKKRRKSTRKGAIAAAAAEEDAAGDSSLVEAIPSKRRSFGRGRKQTATGADAELAIEHTLLNPPDLREYGEFTADEAELLRRQVKRYQYEWSLSVHDMVNMIQWTKPYAEGGKANGSNQQEAQQFAASTNFWAQIYDTLPKRKNFKTKGGTTAIQRFVRRKYHNFPKGHGGWTDEEDAELARMYRKYPNSWKKIAEALGDRSESACRDRWRNYVLYGDSRNTAAWSDLELENLAKSIDAVIEADKNDRIKNGRPQLDQYTSRDINWKFVSDKVGTRSRLQCQMKWRGMQNRPYQEKKEKEAKKAPKAKAKAKKEAKPKTGPGFEKMLGGDKLDIILALSECAPETEEDIDWEDVKEKEEGSRGGSSPWSKKDRQAVLKELGDAVGEQDDFSTTLNAIALYLQDMYGAEGLEEHYDPAEDPELAEEVQEKGTKRKRASEGAKALRGSSFKKFKSADTISASDEE